MFTKILTKDSVTVAVDAVVYFRIFDPIMAVCNIQDAQKATRLLAATTLRNVLGTRAMSEVLSERESISHEMQVQHRDNQHCDAIRLWFFICLFWICFVFWTFREFSLRWRRLCLCFLHSCRRYMAENCRYGIKHQSINQSINQSTLTTIAVSLACIYLLRHCTSFILVNQVYINQKCILDMKC